MLIGKAIILSPLFIVFLFAAACTQEKNNTSFEVPVYSVPSVPAWPALAILRTGENPLWFEFGQSGPILIDSPEEAAVTPFTPWPHARYATGMLLWDDFLVMAVNRDGFLVLESEKAASKGTELAMYRVSGGGFWEPYTAGSLFILENKPAVLLYRNDFFAEAEAPLPERQVFLLDTQVSVPAAVNIPAFDFISGDWEAEELHRGRDGFWYFRMREKEKEMGETAYFRSADPKSAGTKISMTEWVDSLRWDDLQNLPPLLLAALSSAEAEISPAGISSCAVLSPDFESPLFFTRASAAGEGETMTRFYGYYGEARDTVAFVIDQAGRGVSARYDTSKIIVSPFVLPPLPEGFVYSGTALFGNTIVSLWEEQEGAGIGAAGFMAVELPDNTD